MSRRLSSIPLLSLRDATFRLGDRLVFPDTSWVFRRNEQWAILGPNGSGKSLFADCLRGKLPLVRGELGYHFRPPLGLSPEEAIGHVAFEERRRELHGAVVQSRWNSIEEEGALLVREYLAYERVMELNPFEVRLDDAAARAAFAKRCRRAIRLLEATHLKDRALLTLSNGERQRVELARALSRTLGLLILDEPFAGLDRTARKHFTMVLEHLMASPLRVLFITARPEDLPKPATHILQVQNCRVVRSGPRVTVLPQRGRTTRPYPAPTSRTPPSSAQLANDSLGFRKKKLRTPLVQLEDVTVRYGNNLILDHFNWTIYAGESWALLGPNGSGKSTILSLVQGDHPQAYRNNVAVCGYRRGSGESIWDIKEKIGSVSPELQAHFPQEATCFETVASGFFDSSGLFETPTAAQRRATRFWLRRFGLLELADTPLFGLSAGAQRLALLARALVKSPQLLLLDEPCQGLDQACCRLFIPTVDRLVRQGSVTVVYVTHREEEIPRSIKRVLRLKKTGAA